MSNQIKTIRLNKHFYSKEALLLVKKRFEEVATINFIDRGDLYEIVLNNMKDASVSQDDVLREFANHCLAESK
jgi:hypothetical protein